MSKDKKPRIGRPPSDDPKDGIVKFRCRRSDKGWWVLKARREGRSLSEWLVKTANLASRDVRED